MTPARRAAAALRTAAVTAGSLVGRGAAGAARATGSSLRRWLPVLLRRARDRPRLAGVAAGAALLAIVLALARERTRFPREAILDAIRQVESSGRLHPPDGDGGLAIGPFQIHRRYWQDAVDHEPRLGGTYEDCRDPDYATRVVAAYMERWAPAAWARGEAETIARIHNGGPRGAAKDATVRYWQRVRRELERRR